MHPIKIASSNLEQPSTSAGISLGLSPNIFTLQMTYALRCRFLRNEPGRGRLQQSYRSFPFPFTSLRQYYLHAQVRYRPPTPYYVGL